MKSYIKRYYIILNIRGAPLTSF